MQYAGPKLRDVIDFLILKETTTSNNGLIIWTNKEDFGRIILNGNQEKIK